MAYNLGRFRVGANPCKSSCPFGSGFLPGACQKATKLQAMPEKALKTVAAKYHLTAEQATQVVRLLEAGYSIPYLMRYHKELAGGMQADGFYELIEEHRRLEKLEARRRKTLRKLQEREILTPELEEKINRAHDLRELIDYYVPFRPRKRSRSRQALAQGLRPLASQVLSQEQFIPDMGVAAEPYVSPQQSLDTAASVLEGVFHIVSDWVAEEKAHRDRQRDVFRQEAQLVVRQAGSSVPGRFVREFRAYFDFRQKASNVHPYHMLAILRGKRLKLLEYRLDPPLQAMMHAAADLYLAGGSSQFEQIQAELGTLPADDGERLKGLNGTEFLAACLKHGLESVLADVTARELDKDLCKQAESLALEIIRRNVRAMLMAPPLHKRMLGIHPGYRTGCSLAAVDEKGDVLEAATVYPHPPQNELEQAKEAIRRLIEQHKLEVVAIGDGTGAEETEALLCGLIAEAAPSVQYTVLSQVAVEAYATSRGAKNELPTMEPAQRCAVALCRRLQDPLSELAKVNPRELCPQPYADDVNSGALKKLLDRTFEECVCDVGVDANTAHYSLLRYVCGLGPDKALALVEHRDKNGPLKSREDLRNVPGIDQDSYERAAGFIRVAASASPLDATRIHPRFYPAAEEMCSQLGLPLAGLSTPEARQQLRQRAPEVKLADLEKRFSVHYLLLKDIVAELCDPWPDPRKDGQGPVLRQRRPSMDELQPDQWLTGTVRNIVDFGVFVDIGVGEDGLIHISEMSDGYVKSPYDVACVGDRIRVRVVRVDKEKRRIALSLRSEGGRKERRVREPVRRRAAEPSRAEPQPVAAEAAGKPLPSSVHAPRSTLGWSSRRVQKAQLAERVIKSQQEPPSKPEPEPERPPERPEEKDGESAPEGVGGLLDKLGFASIERRGKPSS